VPALVFFLGFVAVGIVVQARLWRHSPSQPVVLFSPFISDNAVATTQPRASGRG
jgi:hypothetical protein